MKGRQFRVRETVHSLKTKLVILFLLVILPLCMMFFGYADYSRRILFNEIAKSNNNLMELYIREMDEVLNSYESFLLNTLVTNTDIQIFATINDLSDSNYTYEKVQIGNLLQDRLLTFNKMYAIFCYSQKTNDMVFQTYESNADGFNADELLQHLSNSDNPIDSMQRDWQLVYIGDEYYLLRVFGQSGIYIGACVRISDLMEPLDLINFGNDGFAFIVSSDLKPITNSELVNKLSLELRHPSNSTYYLTGTHSEFLILGSGFSSGEFYLFTAIPDYAILENLPLTRLISFMEIVLSVLSICVFFIVVRRLLFAPLNRINSTMHDFVNKDIETRLVPEKSSSEFEVISDTFNSMLTQIESLKVRMYEDEIERQRAELKHLQLQVNPHFFMNSLNMIFQLAQVHQYDLIQRMTSCLSQYFRFMFKSNSDYVRLCEEIQHVDNYLSIQQMRFPKNLVYSIDCTDSLNDFNVPPLIIQSMVENSIKYALTLDDITKITVAIKQIALNDEDLIEITVQDNGNGFPQEVIDEFTDDVHENSPTFEGTGIRNAKRRVSLLYGKKAKISISNLRPNGASVVILLPGHRSIEKGRIADV